MKAAKTTGLQIMDKEAREEFVAWLNEAGLLQGIAVGRLIRTLMRQPEDVRQALTSAPRPSSIAIIALDDGTKDQARVLRAEDRMSSFQNAILNREEHPVKSKERSATR